MATSNAARHFLGAVRRHAMLPPGSRVLAAVSGGADSVALVRLLCEHRAALALASVRVCHVNHLLRGEESDRDEAFVRALCAELGLPLCVHREDAAAFAARRGMSPEEGARALRYAAFERLRQGAERVATAHTLSDSAETFFLNLLRGSGLTGLSGIPAVRGPFVRPLIDCTRADVEDYLSAGGFAFVTDSGNLTDRYARNRVRHTLMPALARLSPGYESAMGRAMRLLRRDADVLDALTQRTLEALRCGEGFSAEGLAAQGPLLERLLHALLASAGADDYRHVALCADCVHRGSGAVALRGGARFAVHAGVAYLLPAPPAAASGDAVLLRKSLLLERPLTALVGQSNILLYVCESPPAAEVGAADYDRLNTLLLLRPHRPGDRLRQPGRGLSKSVRALVSEARVPPHRRADTVVALSGGRTVWVQGFGCDARARPDARTRRFVCFETKE